ncbi:MAG: hypothetical protein L0323_15070 [Planctomycetes bacterium]|nr:hypothetical protein [Planctomycetota bacterium]
MRAIPVLVLIAASRTPVRARLGPAPPQAPPPGSREGIERDLAVEVRLKTPDRVQPWWPIWFDSFLVNRSKERTYPFVRPGNGSDAGWREPHVFCTTEFETGDGAWREAPREGGARCGNYSADWRGDVAILGPGESIPLEWIRGPSFREVVGAKRLRFRVHYDYGAKPAKAAWWNPPLPLPEGLGDMVGVTPFEVVSPPVELEVLAPEVSKEEMEKDLVLDLVRESPGRIRPWEPLEIVGKASLANRSPERRRRIVRPDFRRLDSRLEVVAELETKDGSPHRIGMTFLGRRFSEHSDWREEVVEMDPGGVLPFVVPPIAFVEAQQRTGTWRIRLRYGYGAQCVYAPRVTPPPEGLGRMADVPPFAILSNPIEVVLERPLDLLVASKGRIPTDRESRASEVLDFRIVNRSDESIVLASPSEPGRIDFHCSPVAELVSSSTAPPPDPGATRAHALGLQVGDDGRIELRESIALGPGESVRLGEGPLAGGADPVLRVHLDPRYRLKQALVSIEFRRKGWSYAIQSPRLLVPIGE